MKGYDREEDGVTQKEGRDEDEKEEQEGRKARTRWFE